MAAQAGNEDNEDKQSNYKKKGLSQNSGHLNKMHIKSRKKKKERKKKNKGFKQIASVSKLRLQHRFPSVQS